MSFLLKGIKILLENGCVVNVGKDFIIVSIFLGILI